MPDSDGYSELIEAARLNLARITAFVAVARKLSFTEAAVDLCVVQPWVSTQVRSLERDLGLTLFDRSNHRHLRLTAQGDELMSAAELLVGSAAVFGQRAKGLARRSSGELTLGTPPYATAFPERHRLVSAFAAAYPDISITTHYGSSSELLVQLRRGHLDLAFLLDPEPDEELPTVAVQRLHLFLVVPRDHPLARSGPIGVAEVSGYEVASFARERSPAVFDRRFAPLLDAGARLVSAPDGMPDAVQAFAQDRGLLSVMALPDGPRVDPAHALLRPMTGPTATAELRLVAVEARLAGPALMFWTLAKHAAHLRA